MQELSQSQACQCQAASGEGVVVATTPAAQHAQHDGCTGSIRGCCIAEHSYPTEYQRHRHRPAQGTEHRVQAWPGTVLSSCLPCSPLHPSPPTRPRCAPALPCPGWQPASARQSPEPAHLLHTWGDHSSLAISSRPGNGQGSHGSQQRSAGQQDVLTHEGSQQRPASQPDPPSSLACSSSISR